MFSRCDNRFHTEALNELLESDEKFGFIVMDGNGCLFGTLSGQTNERATKRNAHIRHRSHSCSHLALASDLFASGNTRAVIHKFSVDLPKKHGRGGQSALRFARLRLEKRHNYLRKVAEMATQLFITQDRPNVSGLILAGSAEFKTKLNASDLFDPRLAVIVQKIVDVSYGQTNQQQGTHMRPTHCISRHSIDPLMLFNIALEFMNPSDYIFSY